VDSVSPHPPDTTSSSLFRSWYSRPLQVDSVSPHPPDISSSSLFRSWYSTPLQVDSVSTHPPDTSSSSLLRSWYSSQFKWTQSLLTPHILPHHLYSGAGTVASSSGLSLSSPTRHFLIIYIPELVQQTTSSGLSLSSPPRYFLIIYIPELVQQPVQVDSVSPHSPDTSSSSLSRSWYSSYFEWTQSLLTPQTLPHHLYSGAVTVARSSGLSFSSPPRHFLFISIPELV
jgi:hypothetical protein